MDRQTDYSLIACATFHYVLRPEMKNNANLIIQITGIGHVCARMVFIINNSSNTTVFCICLNALLETLPLGISGEGFSRPDALCVTQPMLSKP